MNIRHFLILAMTIIISSCSKTGSSIPDFELNNLNGETIGLKDLKGKIVVMQVWATWCGTCVQEIPELNRLANKYRDDHEVLFIALNDESEEKVVNFLQRWPFRFMHITDAEQYTSKLQSRLVKTYPQTIILNKESVVVFDQSNGTADVFSQIDSKIQEIKNQ